MDTPTSPSARQNLKSRRGTLTRKPPTLLMVMAFAALTGCASLIPSPTASIAENLGRAILNQNDPETVQDGAPAFLLMLDSFVEGSPNDTIMLSAAAELYAAYGVVFVDDPERAVRLTSRALSYAQRALCVSNTTACGIWEQAFADFVVGLERLRAGDAPALYTLGLSWLASIRTQPDNWLALAQLPQVEAILNRVQALDPAYRRSKVEHYLGVLNTVRPPALGGRFSLGQEHYRRAIELSEGRDLSIKVDYAKFYARTLYQRELHDRLLEEVVAADPDVPGFTLFNRLAQRDARALLESADAYF
jgi:hypothetical protein